MRTEAHNLACVRDPAIELLLGHVDTLTEEQLRVVRHPGARPERDVVALEGHSERTA